MATLPIMVSLMFTYAKLEPDHEGDYCETGYWQPGGWEYAMDGSHSPAERARFQAECSLTMHAHEALREVERHVGTGEFNAQGNVLTFYDQTGDENFRTGIRTYRSAHIKAHPRLIAAMVRRLRAT